jgi:hypothetical protein
MWPELRHPRKQEVKLRAKNSVNNKNKKRGAVKSEPKLRRQFFKIFSNETRAISGTPFDEDRQCITIICRGRGGGEDNCREKTSA